MGFEIRKNEKHVKAEEFVKEMKKMHKEANVVLRKLQECYVLGHKLFFIYFFLI